MSRRCYEVKLDQCMFGLRAPDTQENIKKPTKMLTTSRSAARNLSVRCDESHSHRTIGGSVSYSRNSRQVRQTLSEFCGGYTEELATAMVLGFEEGLIPVSHLANVVSRKRARDELEEEAARRVARRVGDQEPASSSTDRKKKRRRDFAEELREMTQKAEITKATTRPTTRSMTRGSASQHGATQQDDDQEQVPQHFEEAMGHWIDDMEENIPYLEPEQQDHHQEQHHEETPVPNRQNDNHYHQETEGTPYPQDNHHEQMDVEEVPVQLYYPNDGPPRRDEEEQLPGPDLPRGRDHQEAHQEDDRHRDMSETPQFTPEPGRARQDVDVIPRKEILNDLDFYGNDLAGGEGDVPGIIVRNVPPEVRREVRNAHNLGHPSAATLLRLMRRAGASDAVQRYARISLRGITSTS